jgi:ABC-2 type transport system ATP-binding protein
VHEPRVLLLDEPTTGVDPVTRQDFWQLIIRLTQDNQIAVLVSTPYMDEAARCHRLGFLRQGRLQLEGTPQDLRDHLAGQVLELQGSPLPQIRSIAAADPDVVDAQMFGDRLHLHIQGGTAEAVQQRLQQAVPAAGAQLTHLQLIPAQLEDVFIILVANDHG